MVILYVIVLKIGKNLVWQMNTFLSKPLYTVHTYFSHHKWFSQKQLLKYCMIFNPPSFETRAVCLCTVLVLCKIYCWWHQRNILTSMNMLKVSAVWLNIRYCTTPLGLRYPKNIHTGIYRLPNIWLSQPLPALSAV